MASVRAVVGARVSYVQGDEKTSHITQRGKGEAYAESQGWTVVGAFEDLDVSAIKLSPWERPDLREWLTDRQDDWDALIFAKTDRVFRSAADCVKLAEWCKEHRKILVLVDDGIKLDYYHPEDAKDAFAGAMSKVFLILASVFAEIEGQRFVQRARDRVEFLRKTDRWGYGIPPFGFKIVDHPSGTGKALDHDDEAQEVLSSIVARLLAGGSLTGITARLNDDQVLSPQDWARARAGKPTKGTKWTVDKLRNILSNPSTQGIKTAGGKPVLDSNGEPVRVGPASFDPATWQRVQQELAQRSQDPRKRRHTTNPLLGVAKCGVCGANMRQRSQTTPAGKTHRYYVCGRSPKACPGVSFIADQAEEIVEQVFLESHADRRVVTRIWQAGSDHSAELEQTNATIESLREDRLLGLYATERDQETYRRQMAALIAKRAALERTPIVKAGWIDQKTDETYSEVWPKSTPEQRRKLLTDAGVILTITRPNIFEVYTDLGRLLGESPTGGELLATITGER
ncbi:recombinase family protein [Mycobacterium avium]|uniref:recombinase family protein n=1 Tax=Mycobacterium avium TaxID=1764 RepID=UPI001CC49CF2|nr:recombinase family protein [Mycobacterium avium]MBZ4534505.1 recombinase family protein [Mycobacterium avium subsp. hominissuis]MBZ4591518.1 recombinase family protein [Mycobacterium avium subsp. hominissuis]MBZ4634989.1 recombinase family protein [Mycobacterium avium subsp. hominissuis]